jgi:hypothetical protein
MLQRVILHRRGDEDLRLTTAGRAAAEEAILGALSRVIADVLEDEVVRERISRRQPLPWLQFLPPTERQLFYQDLFHCVQGAVEVGTLAPVARLLDEWRATAAIHADPDLVSRLRQPVTGNGGVVARPAVE